MGNRMMHRITDEDAARMIREADERDEYDANGRRVARTCGNDPNHPDSWRNEYDANGRLVACVYGNDPSNPRSWRADPKEGA